MGDDTDEKKNEEDPQPVPGTSKPQKERRTRKRRKATEDELSSYDGLSRSGYSSRSPPRKQLRIRTPVASRTSHLWRRGKPEHRGHPGHGGRVTKKRSPRQEPKRRRTPHPKGRGLPRRKTRSPSINTLFTRMSSRSRSESPGCRYCGHRCCGRRSGVYSTYVQRRKLVRTVVRKIYNQKNGLPLNLATGDHGAKRTKGNREGPLKTNKNPVSEAIQQGSPAMTLSPLCLNTYNSVGGVDDDLNPSSKVTPEIMYEAMRYLTPLYPRDYVPFKRILNHIMNNWPVNQSKVELSAELKAKLEVAQKMGLVEHKLLECDDLDPGSLFGSPKPAEKEPHWRLCDELLNKGNKPINKNHVTKFWLLYGDTMKPASRKRPREEASDESTKANADNVGKLHRTHSGDPCCSKRLKTDIKTSKTARDADESKLCKKHGNPLKLCNKSLKINVIRTEPQVDLSKLCSKESKVNLNGTESQAELSKLCSKELRVKLNRTESQIDVKMLSSNSRQTKIDSNRTEQNAEESKLSEK